MLRSAGTLLLGLLIWGARGLPQPDDSRIGHNQDLDAVQEDLLLKLLSGWTDSREGNSLEVGRNSPELPEDKSFLSSRFPHLSLRERKATCKNFFWKTFTMC
ncbi:cortistatin [Gastrophryne carolinensis]